MSTKYSTPFTTKNRLISFRARTTMKMGIQPSNFGNTQCMESPNQSRPHLVQKLDRENSGKEVERLLKLRRQLLRDAKECGDEAEVRRLENLGLFDDILPPPCASPTEATEKGPNIEIGSIRAEPSFISSSDWDSQARMKPLPDLPSTESLTLYSANEDGDNSLNNISPSISRPQSSAFDLFLSLAHTEAETDPFLNLALEAQPPRRLRRQQKQHTLRTPISTDLAKPLPATPAPAPFPQKKADESVSALQSRISSLSQSPILTQLIRDIGLLAHYRAGLYDPGEPEIRDLEKRVEFLKESVVVRQLEMDLLALEG